MCPSDSSRMSGSQQIPSLGCNPKVPSLHSHKPTTSPYPSPDESSQHYPSYFSKNHFNILPTMPRSSKQPPSFKILPDTCYMPYPYHPWFDNIWLGVQIMKFFIIQFSPPSCSWPPAYSSTLLKHSRPVFLP